MTLYHAHKWLFAQGAVAICLDVYTHVLRQYIHLAELKQEHKAHFLLQALPVY